MARPRRVRFLQARGDAPAGAIYAEDLLGKLVEMRALANEVSAAQRTFLQGMSS